MQLVDQWNIVLLSKLLESMTSVFCSTQVSLFVTIFNKGAIFDIRPIIHISVIVKSTMNLFLEATSAYQWG